MGLVTAAGNHGPPSGTRAPIALTKRLSLGPGGSFSCVEREASGKRDREAFLPSPGPFPIPGRVVNGGITLLSSPPRFSRRGSL